MEKEQLSYGQQLVGVNFNPSGNEDVDYIKGTIAELIDFSNEKLIPILKKNAHIFPMTGENSKSTIANQLQVSISMDLLDAQMKLVKLITM